MLFVVQHLYDTFITYCGFDHFFPPPACLLHFTLKGPRFTVEIEVGEDWAALAGTVKEELEHLHGVQMRPGALLLVNACPVY